MTSQSRAIFFFAIHSNKKKKKKEPKKSQREYFCYFKIYERVRTNIIFVQTWANIWYLLLVLDISTTKFVVYRIQILIWSIFDDLLSIFYCFLWRKKIDWKSKPQTFNFEMRVNLDLKTLKLASIFIQSPAGINSFWYYIEVLPSNQFHWQIYKVHNTFEKGFEIWSLMIKSA